MSLKPSTFRIVDLVYYERWLEYKKKGKDTKKYKVYNLQLLLGRKSNNGKHWTPVITFIMDTRPDGQLAKFLKALYTVSTITKISQKLTAEYFWPDKTKVAKAHDADYTTVCNILQADIRKNQYHIVTLLKEVTFQSGTIKQFDSIKKAGPREKYYKNEVFNWPHGFTPGQPPEQKTSLDLHELDVASLNIAVDDDLPKRNSEAERAHHRYIEDQERKEELRLYEQLHPQLESQETYVEEEMEQ